MSNLVEAKSVSEGWDVLRGMVSAERVQASTIYSLEAAADAVFSDAIFGDLSGSPENTAARRVAREELWAEVIAAVAATGGSAKHLVTLVQALAFDFAARGPRPGDPA